jgi:hypothetical protein
MASGFDLIWLSLDQYQRISFCRKTCVSVSSSLFLPYCGTRSHVMFMLWLFLSLTVPGSLAFSHRSTREILTSEGHARYIYVGLWLSSFVISCCPLWALRQKGVNKKQQIESPIIVPGASGTPFTTFLFLAHARASGHDSRYARDEKRSIIVYALGQTLELAKYQAVEHLKFTGWRDIEIQDAEVVDPSRSIMFLL